MTSRDRALTPLRPGKGGRNRRSWWVLIIPALAVVSWLSVKLIQRPTPLPPCTDPSFLEGERAFLAGDNAQAVACLRRCIEANPREVRAYRDLVDAMNRQGTLNEGEEFLRGRLKADSLNACVHYAMGKLFFRRNDLKQGEKFAWAAIRLDPRLGWAHLLLGLIRHSSGMPRSAVESYERARRIFIRQGDAGSEALALNNIAGVLLDLNETERALKTFQEGLACQRSLGRKEAELLALGNVGLTQVRLGDSKAAIETFREGIDLARELRDRAVEWKLHDYLGFAYRTTGEYEKALACADSTIALAVKTHDRMGEVAGRYTEASVWVDLGDPLRALQISGPALELAESMGQTRYRVDLILLCADAQFASGEPERARQGYLLCDSLARSARLSNTAVAAQAALCRMALKDGDDDGALSLGEKSLEYCRQASSRDGEAQISIVLAGVYLTCGDLARALSLADRGVALNREVGSRIDLARSLARRARVRLCTGDRSGAKEDAREGEKLAISLCSPELLAECEWVAGDIRRGEDPAAALSHYRKAMKAVETIRRNLHRRMGEAGALEDQTQIYFTAANLLVEQGQIEEAFEVCERSRARMLRDLLPSGANIPTPDESIPAQIGQSIGSLTPDEALLEYFLGPDSSLCFVARDGTVRAVRLPQAAGGRLSRTIDSLRAPWVAPRSLSTLDLDQERLLRLRRMVLDPVLPELGGIETLIIAPDGPLHLWPFEPFPLPGAAGLLGDVFTTCYIPSLRFLSPPSRPSREATSDSTQGTLLALGYAGPANLAHAENEAVAIARLFPGGTARVGREATKESYTRLAPHFRYLHLSAHAVADQAVPLHSGLFLAPDSAGIGDGVLRASEILSLPNHCDLVTLSACQTAGGRLYAGEGVVGLTFAFLSAGARQVLVSLWSVNDASTEILMRRFYENLRGGLTPARALREAKRNLREVSPGGPKGGNPDTSHPFFWAPFVLVGR